MAFSVLLRRFPASQCYFQHRPLIARKLSVDAKQKSYHPEPHIAKVLSQITFPRSQSKPAPRIFSDDVDQIVISEAKRLETERILHSIRKARSLQEKFEIYKTQVLPAGRNASEAAFRHMIGIAAANDHYEVLMQVYNDRKKLGYLPTDRIALWLARVATKRGNAEMLRQVYNDFKNSDVVPEQNTLTMLIALSEKLRKFELAQEFYAAMIRWHGQPDSHSYNVIIRMCCKAGYWDHGIKYAEENLRRADPLGIARETREHLEATVKRPAQLSRAAKENRSKMAELYKLFEEHPLREVYS